MIDILRQIISGFTWWVVVAPWERALRIRLGRYVKDLPAGFYIRIPFIDRVYRQSIRYRRAIIRPQTLTTADGKVVTVSGSIGYSVDDMRKLYDTLECPQDTIELEVASLVAEFVSSREYAAATPRAIEAHVSAKLDLGKYGLSGQAYQAISYVTAKTYRLIQGDLPQWNHDRAINMDESKPGP